MKTQDLFDVGGLSVLITGGAKGLGRAFAEAMLDNGARVTLLDCDGESLDRAVIELRDRGTAVHGDVVDVTDRADRRRPRLSVDERRARSAGCAGGDT